VLNEAELPFNTALPKVAEPLRKVTVPVAIVLPPCEVTAAVNVTFCPATGCATELVNVVVVCVGPALGLPGS
jgi:hypothetical protein